MQIRSYHKDDNSAILEIFDSNCPRYFQASDKESLIDFLNSFADKNFYVCVIDNIVLGCGGYYIKKSEKKIGIAWAMFKRLSLGHKKFTEVRDEFFQFLISQIEQEKLDFDIIINTTQLLEKTFIRFGFVTEKIVSNGFGEGLDHYVMRLKK